MRAFDTFLRFLSLSALVLIAGMLYVQYFHQGGRPASVTVNLPPKMAVTNAAGEPLRIVGEVTLPRPPAAAPVKLKLNCKLTSMIVTQKPGMRLFGGTDWKPEREWPLEGKLECETVESTQ